MTTLALTNGARHNVKDLPDIIDEKIRLSDKFITLTLVKQDNAEERCRYRINAIAYWY